MRLLVSGSVVFALASSWLACGGAPPAVTPHGAGKTRADAAGSANGGVNALPPVAASPFVEVVRVRPGTLGPYWAALDARPLLSWVESEGGKQRLRAAGEGGPTHDVAVLNGEARLLAVGRVRADAAGIALVEGGKDGDSIVCALVDAQGNATTPLTRMRALGSVPWLEVASIGGKPVVLWASQTAASAVELHVASFDGKEGGELANEVHAFQLAVDGARAAFALVRSSKLGGRVELLEVGPRLSAGEPVRLADGGAADEIELALDGERAFVAWTDHAGSVPTLLGVSVANGRRQEVPRSLVSAVDPLALHALATLGLGRFVLGFERIGGTTGGRRLSLVELTADGRAQNGKEVSVPLGDDASPELAVAGGVARVLAPRGAEPPLLVTLAPSGVLGLPLAAPLAWGLRCGGGKCRVLGARGTGPGLTAIALFDERRSGVMAELLSAAPEPLRPHALRWEPLDAGEPFAEVAVTKLASGSRLLATITDFDPNVPWTIPKTPAPDGRLAPVQALVRVRAFKPADGGFRGSELVQQITLRARSLGGISISAGAPDAAWLGWTAIDGAAPQVFVTKLGDDGRRVLQRMVTNTRGEKHEVRVAAAGDGSLVAFGDERDGERHLYVARLGPTLQPVGPQRKLSRFAPAVSASLLVDGETALLLDAEPTTKGGPSQIVLRRLTAADGAEKQLEVLTKTAALEPRLGRCDGKVAVSWLEPSGDGVAAQLAFGFVGANVERVALAGEPTSLTLADDDAAGPCRGAVSVERAGRSELYGFERSGGTTRIARLVTLAGPGAQPVPGAFLGSELLVADKPQPQVGVLRRLIVSW